MHGVQKKGLPSHNGRLIERMNDRFLHAHIGEIGSITQKYFISSALVGRYISVLGINKVHMHIGCELWGLRQ